MVTGKVIFGVVVVVVFLDGSGDLSMAILILNSKQFFFQRSGYPNMETAGKIFFSSEFCVTVKAPFFANHRRRRL